MFFRLVLLLTIVPLLELIVLLKFGRIIGVWSTILLILLTGVIGSLLAHIQGTQTVARIQERLRRNQIPAGEMLDGVLIFAAGLLLLTPGFITDFIGFMLLIPMTRTSFRELLRRRFQVHISRMSRTHYSRESTAYQHSDTNDNGPTIDVEAEHYEDERDK